MVELDDGTYPWIQAGVYPKAGTADQTAWRIRHGKVVLPDLYGGEGGWWDAKVERKVRGRKGKNGPAVLWVRYLGDATTKGHYGEF